MNIPLVARSILSQQTQQQGDSSSLPNFLQCLSSIRTIGSFSTADIFARFFGFIADASCSLTRRIISNRSSDAKLELKLLMKLLGLNSLYSASNTSTKLRSRSLTKFSIWAPTLEPSFWCCCYEESLVLFYYKLVGMPDGDVIPAGKPVPCDVVIVPSRLWMTTYYGGGIDIPPT